MKLECVIKKMGLSVGTYRELRKEMPAGWVAAVTTRAGREEMTQEQEVFVVGNPTLRDGKEVRLASATIAQLYAIGIAGRWVMQRAFR